MATCVRTALKALAGCQMQLLSVGGPKPARVSEIVPRNLPVRTFAAVRPWKKAAKEEVKEVKREQKVVDDTGRHKPYGKTAWAPVDDVYLWKFYPRPVHGAAQAVELLKGFQTLDLTPHNQAVYVDLKLNMKLEKKKKVDPFVGTVQLPHPFRTELNKVLVFTENPDQARVAQENGAAFVGGAELIERILEDNVRADFYVTVPEMLQKIVPLKNKLRKKFPKSKRGSVGINIAQMLQMFKTGHEYLVENDCYVRTQFATLDMLKDHILENLRAMLEDVCSHREASPGHFIERAIISSQTSEALWFESRDLLPEPAEGK